MRSGYVALDRSNLDSAGINSYEWTEKSNPADPTVSYFLHFTASIVDPSHDAGRSVGFPVRCSIGV